MHPLCSLFSYICRIREKRAVTNDNHQQRQSKHERNEIMEKSSDRGPASRRMAHGTSCHLLRHHCGWCTCDVRQRQQHYRLYHFGQSFIQRDDQTPHAERRLHHVHFRIWHRQQRHGEESRDEIASGSYGGRRGKAAMRVMGVADVPQPTEPSAGRHAGAFEEVYAYATLSCTYIISNIQ